MTILSACQKAAVKLHGAGSIPVELFASTDEFAIELRTLANEVAETAAKAHDWRKLTVLKTQGGDGSDTSFALPADYDRMPLKAKIWSLATNTPFCPVRDLDAWLELQLITPAGTPGHWIILGGELQILPAMAASESAKYYYISSYLWSTSAGTAATKTDATLDSDVCVLPERLIALGVVWRHKMTKGKEYGEDLRNYEIAFGEEAGRDKGSRILAVGRPRLPAGVELAYPVPIVV